MNNRRSFLTKIGLGGLAAATVGLSNVFGKDTKGKKVLVHQVYFWLKKDLTSAQREIFDKGVKSLINVKTVKYGDVGKPGATGDRPVVEKSYDYALLTVFDDVKGHDAYMVDPIHEKFLSDCKELWEKVVVYDAATA